MGDAFGQRHAAPPMAVVVTRSSSPKLEVNLSEGDQFSKRQRKGLLAPAGFMQRMGLGKSTGPTKAPTRKERLSTEESFKFSKVANKLRDVKLFERLSMAELELLVESAKELTLSCDEWVFQEGEKGDALFVIKSGTASVLKQMDNQAQQIAELQQWSVFGERALLKGELRFAGVQATSETLVLLTITSRDFEKAVGLPLQEILEAADYDPAERAARRQRRLKRQKSEMLQSFATKQKVRMWSAFLDSCPGCKTQSHSPHLAYAFYRRKRTRRICARSSSACSDGRSILGGVSLSDGIK